MRVRPSQLRALPSFLVPFTQQASGSIQVRCLHSRMAAPKIPAPTPFVPDTETFLKLIGRNLSQHAAKIPSWEALFSLTSAQLKELGIEPPRSRRYLLRWREKFRNGDYGIGGEAQSVVDGVAHLRVVEVPETNSGAAQEAIDARKVISNVRPGLQGPTITSEQLVPIKGLHIKRSHTITGPHVLPVKGTGGRVAQIAVKEGLWEDRRGHKIDGGERRQAEVRAKRRSEERKQTR